MVLDIKIPEAGFSITEGKVIEWRKREGERVEAGETILSIETDKISVDIPAERSGVLREIRVKAGETAPVGGVVGVLFVEETGLEAVPDAGAGGRDVPGSSERDIERGVSRAGRGGGPETSSPGSGAHARPIRAAGPKRKVSPLAKALARSHGIDPAAIPEGSGPEGRVVKEDVLRYIDALGGGTAEQSPARESVPAPQPLPKPATPGGIPAASTAPAAPESTVEPRAAVVPSVSAAPAAGVSRRIPYAGWRKVIAERMTASIRNAPQYTMSTDADVTELSALIASTRERAETPKLTVLPFVMKACVAGIGLVPEVNAYCFDDGYSLEAQVNIGIAVDLGEKLLVPVVKNVRAKSILQLAGEIRDLADRARGETLERGDVEGGTFTITNVGVYGVHSGTPILLQPQSCIMYIGAIRKEPGVVNDEIRIRRRVTIGVTVDHRIVNGGPGARFLGEVRSHLENPSRLLLTL